MRYTEAKQGRVFVIRLEDGDVIHEQIEKFARQQSIKAASLLILGGVDKMSKLVVGPKDGRAKQIEPIEHILSNVHEVTGVGTLFPDDEGAPMLHMHIACGRGASTVAGCIRRGVKAWHVLEVILFELVDTDAKRIPDETTGFKLLDP